MDSNKCNDTYQMGVDSLHISTLKRYLIEFSEFHLKRFLIDVQIFCSITDWMQPTDTLRKYKFSTNLQLMKCKKHKSLSSK